MALSLWPSSLASPACSSAREPGARFDPNHHFVHAVGPRDLDFVMRRQAPASRISSSICDGNTLTPADDQHVVAAAGDLREAAHRGDASRQQAGQIARAVADHRHGFLGERGEHQLALLAVADAPRRSSDRRSRAGNDPPRSSALPWCRRTPARRPGPSPPTVRRCRRHRCRRRTRSLAACLRPRARRRICRCEARSTRASIPCAPELIEDGEHVARRDHDDVGLEIA